MNPGEYSGEPFSFQINLAGRTLQNPNKTKTQKTQPRTPNGQKKKIKKIPKKLGGRFLITLKNTQKVTFLKVAVPASSLCWEDILKWNWKQVGQDSTWAILTG